ncbi:unnamed protein product [Closterium sp. NIES-53]
MELETLELEALELEALELETLELEPLELEVPEVLELEVPEVLEPLVLEVLVLEVLELPELVVLEALELETLELEALELETLELEALELEALELEALVLEAQELEELELEALELEALELETLELEMLALGVLELALLVLSLTSSTGLNPPFLCPPPHQSQPLLQPVSPLPAPSPYAEQTNSLIKCCEPESRPASPVRAVRTGRRVPCPRPPHVPGTHIMALRPSSVPLRVTLPSPPASSLADGPDPESDLVCAASPTVTRLLATVFTDPSFESDVVSALVSELVDFGAACRLDYAASLVAESESDCPLSVGGECALGTDVFEDRQEDFECLAVAGYTFSLGSGSVSWWSTRSSSVLSSSCEAEIYGGAMAAQELRWLTYVLTDLGERPSACLAYVATRANTADIFTKALQPCDHQRFCTVLGLVPTLPHLLTA